MNLIAYARVSTLDSNVEQMAKYLREWADKNRHVIVEMHKDKESGRIPLHLRKKFKKIISRVPFSNADGLLVIAIDRITRNWYDQGVIEKVFSENWEVCKLVSAFDRVDLGTASGRAMFRMQMAMSCFEVERMFERQVIGIERAKAEGKFKGRKVGSKNKVRK